MAVALDAARKGFGRTSPNPAVGAVLVSGGKIIAKGSHERAGGAHAEIACLRNFARPMPKNATLYVTLEPCSTAGRTGACTAAIIHAGVRRVIIGAADPNPRHAGNGIQILRKAGIDVQTGILADQCAALNEAYNKWIKTNRPFVIAKCGMSLDGRLTRPAGENRWMTSAASRRHARLLRSEVDAILVGAETVRTDNPRLTARDSRAVKQPWRVVLSRSGRLPRTAHLFTDRFAERTKVYRDGSLENILRDLGQKEVTSVLLEGGGEILSQALDQRLVDKVQIYVAGLLTGGPVIAFPGIGASSALGAARLSKVRYEKIGRDVCITGYAAYGAIPSE